MINVLSSESMRLICLLVLFWAASPSADAAQLGRITSYVNFRESASRSARVISVLAPGTEVSILGEDPGGWYLTIHQGRPGFVHKSYVNLEHHQNSAERVGSIRRHAAMTAGMILISVGVISMVYVLGPLLLKTALFLAGSLMAVVVLDLGFQLGLLYSLFSVLLGLVIAMLFLTRKKAA
jgi:Bacterial SH3 domain